MDTKKRSRSPSRKRSKTPNQGIPNILAAIRYEKPSEIVPVRVPLSVKNCLKRLAGKQGVSSWIRTAILEKLERMTKNESKT